MGARVVINEDIKLEKQALRQGLEAKLSSEPPLQTSNSHLDTNFHNQDFNKKMTIALGSEHWEQIKINGAEVFANMTDEDKILLWSTLETVNFDPSYMDLILKLAKYEAKPNIQALNEQLKFVISCLKERAKSLQRREQSWESEKSTKRKTSQTKRLDSNNKFNKRMKAALGSDQWDAIQKSGAKMFASITDQDKSLLYRTIKKINFDPSYSRK